MIFSFAAQSWIRQLPGDGETKTMEQGRGLDLGRRTKDFRDPLTQALFV